MTGFPTSPGELSRRLALRAEAVCRQYLPRGSRNGRYWLAGDTNGNAGRSLYVRLCGPLSGKGAAGKWRDAATGQHGDLLDLVQETMALRSLLAAMDEASRFLSLAGYVPVTRDREFHGNAEAELRAKRLFAMSRPLPGTPAADYLAARGLDPSRYDSSALRYHPSCHYREKATGSTSARPALVAAATDPDGRITGIHRTWFDPARPGEKARVDSPRRSLGTVLGSVVKFGFKTNPRPPAIFAGEGVETVLSLHILAPSLPAMAAGPADRLAALPLPPGLVRLYIAVDPDCAGRRAASTLARRAMEAGIDVRLIEPVAQDDHNCDLRRLGSAKLADRIMPLLAQADRMLAAA